MADRREDDADAREVDADRRERQMDARERVLDRWEREIAARAATLSSGGDVHEHALEQARAQRAREREQRRADADARRDTAIDREIRRSERPGSATVDRPWSDHVVDASATFAQLATALQTNPPLEDVVNLILAAGVETVPDCAAGSVALFTGGRLETAASTLPWAAELDSVQLQLNAGPLPDAAAGAAMVSTSDLWTDDRWPAFAGVKPVRAERGVVSFGLVVGDQVAGVLTLYAHANRHFTPQALRVGGMLAAHAAATLGRTLERLTYEAQAEAWQHALASRDMIGQAKGILMEQRSTTADEAFDLLRIASQRLNIKLRDVAEHVVVKRRLPDT